jgi:Cu+-exporting ATPase
MKIPWIYFEVSALLITFVSLGKFLEAKAKWKTSEAISTLISITPKIAYVKRWDLFNELLIDEVVVWDIVLVRPWDRIPADWIIKSWNSSIDESMLTWENMPIEKNIWSKVFAWTMNRFWSFEFVVSKIWTWTFLSKIIKLIEDAQLSKAPIQSMVNKISAIFVPFIIWIACITFLIWYFVLWVGFETSMLYFAAVIVVACPCALGLATPTAIMVWTWIWAKYWILIKWWEPLELACKINTVVFDKTWTITIWKPKVTDIISFSDIWNDDLLQIVWSLESKSEHPLSKAIVNHFDENWFKSIVVESFEAIPWKWIRWKVGGIDYIIWTRKLLELNGIIISHEDIISKLEKQGKTVILIWDKHRLIWAIAISDTIRDSSIQVIKDLKNMWINIYMISWDNKNSSYHIAEQVWIDISNVRAEVLPWDKSEEIKKLQADWNIVAMVWDWINDAPALTQADLWIVMWNWSDVAIESWSIIIMKNDLNDIVSAIKLSKDTVSKIKQNLFFSLFYNILWIPIAAWFLSKFGFLLRPELAWLIMALSSVSVVLNSLLLKWFKIWKINIISKLIPIFMFISFMFLFLEFAKFSNIWEIINVYTKNNPWVILDINDFFIKNKSKIAFDKLWLPKIFIYSDKLPDSFRMIEWTSIINNNEVIIWYKEAQMMIKEKLFKNIWDEISGFFGIDKVRIVWILEPTNTFLDDVHIMKNSHYDSMTAKNDLLFLQSNKDEIKIFYLYDRSNIPQKLNYIIDNDKFVYNVWSKMILPLYIWYDEAQMMIGENLIKSIGDRISWFFWNEVVVLWFVKKTYSALDMMHFVPKSFKN